MTAPAGTERVKLPSRSVMVPLVVPFWTTPAAIIGSFWSSTTTPETVTRCCAASDHPMRSDSAKTVNFLNRGFLM